MTTPSDWVAAGAEADVVKAKKVVLMLDDGHQVVVVANEGKFIAVLDQNAANDALSILTDHPLGKSATVIGEIQQKQTLTPKVIMETAIGGKRIVQKPYGEQLPRIC